MSILIDDVSIGPMGGGILTEVAIDITTPIGITVQLRGAATTPTSPVLVIKRSSDSVTLTATAASGKMTASLTAANLTTLNATLGDTLTAFWSGTITDGSDTHLFRLEQSIGVSDRQLRFPIDYSRLTTKLIQSGKTCSVPTGQSNWWPQIRVALEDLRDDINSQQAGVKTYFLSNAGTLRRISETYALTEMLAAMVGQTNGQGSRLAEVEARYLQKKDAIWADTGVVVRQIAAWQIASAKTTVLAKPVQLWSGMGDTGYGGGGIL